MRTHSGLTFQKLSHAHVLCQTCVYRTHPSLNNILNAFRKLNIIIGIFIEFLHQNITSNNVSYWKLKRLPVESKTCIHRKLVVNSYSKRRNKSEICTIKIFVPYNDTTWEEEVNVCPCQVIIIFTSFYIHKMKESDIHENFRLSFFKEFTHFV